MKTLRDYFTNAGIDTDSITNRTGVSREMLEQEITQEMYDAFSEYHGSTMSSSVCDALLDAFTDIQGERKGLELEMLCSEGLYYTPSEDEPMPLPTEEDFPRLEKAAEANLKGSGGLTSVHQDGYVIDRPVSCKFYLKDGDRLNKLDITFHMELDSVDPRKLTMDQVTENINAELRARTKSKLKISPYCVVILSGYCLGEVVGSRVWYRTKLDEETGEIIKVKPGIEEWKEGLEEWSDGIMVHVPFDGYEKSTYRAIEEEVNKEIMYGGNPAVLSKNAYLELGGMMLTEGDLYLHRHLVTRRYEEDDLMWKERMVYINLERPFNMEWIEKQKEGWKGKFKNRKEWIDYEGAYQRVRAAVNSITKGDKATMVLYGETDIDIKDIKPALTHAATGRGQKFSYKVYRALVALKAA